MLSVQLDLSVGDALSRLRAYAYAEGRPINDVAQEIVDRRLRIGEAEN
jgi:AmiR/NasT family two-component response regulator